MPRREHPPKKKHTARPRSAIVPLTDKQREDRARKQIEKAATHLREAESIEDAPNARVHSAYYAMHHAAAAAILMSGGVGKFRDVPASHEHLIEHFGKFFAAKEHPLHASALALNRARTFRVVADYDLDQNASLDEAKDVTREAQVMPAAIILAWPALRPT